METMERKELIDEIIDFCYKYRLFSHSENAEKIRISKDRIEEQLKEVSFVEGLIHLLTVKTQHNKNIDIKKLKELLLELEKIRLDLEYNGSCEKC